MEILDDHRQNRLVHLIEQGAHESALELLKGDNHISKKELHKSLISACQHGNTLIVQMLIRRGASVRYRDTDGNTPLLISVQNGFTDIVKFIFRRKVDVNACNSVGDSALILSIRSSGSAEITEILLKQRGINIDHQNQDGYTAIMKAAEVKDVETLKILLDEYFNVSRITTSSSRYEFINAHKTRELISTLRETINCRGENVLQIAERCGIGSVFQLLQKHEITKISPLELAMRANDIESFYIFLDCDFLYASDRKKSLDSVFIKICEECSKRDIVHFNDNEIAMIGALLEHGVDANTTWIDPVFDREISEGYRFDRLMSRPFIQVCSNRRIDLMHIAAKSGCLKVLQLLLSHKADINKCMFSESPLHIALSHGHTECAILLIQHGAIIDFNQVLRLAVDQQEPRYVRFLIENYKNEVMNNLKIPSNIQDILLRSVRKGNLEIIGQILDLGADINGVVGSGMCPLAESKSGEIAKFLIDRGANVKNSKHNKLTTSDTPLIKVLMSREITNYCVIEVIKELLENGASANDRHWNGKTALMLAAVKEGSMSVMQLLLDHGAELFDRDREGNTALSRAVLTHCVKNVSFLLQCGKDRKELLNVQNYEGLTALMCAVRLRNSTIIKELIDQGADVNIKDTLGNICLLHLLISKSHEDNILKYLIRAGCDVNCQNNEGLSLLMMAAQNYSKDAMCVLLDAGADINAVSKKDNTKTALAHLVYKQDYKYSSCLKYLLCRGASSSYIAATTLHRMIVAGEIHVVPKLIRCGLGPVCVLLNDMLLFNQFNYMQTRSFRSLAYEAGKTFHCSPLCTALCVGNTALARFFVGNLFLTNSDVSVLGQCKWINDHLARVDYKECRDILAEIRQPMTLFNLSFVAVSTAVRATPGREIRVNKLPVPQIIKDKLLFKKLDVALTVPEKYITRGVSARTLNSHVDISNILETMRLQQVNNNFTTYQNSYYENEYDYYDDDNVYFSDSD